MRWGIRFLAGLACAGAGPTGFLTATAVIAEKENLVRFGAPYAAYMKHTRRFVPFLFQLNSVESCLVPETRHLRTVAPSQHATDSAARLFHGNAVHARSGIDRRMCALQAAMDILPLSRGADDLEGRKAGGPGEIRTHDLFHAMEARSQLRHRPTGIHPQYNMTPAPSLPALHLHHEIRELRARVEQQLVRSIRRNAYHVALC